MSFAQSAYQLFKLPEYKTNYRPSFEAYDAFARSLEGLKNIPQDLENYKALQLQNQARDLEIQGMQDKLAIAKEMWDRQTADIQKEQEALDFMSSVIKSGKDVTDENVSRELFEMADTPTKVLKLKDHIDSEKAKKDVQDMNRANFMATKRAADSSIQLTQAQTNKTNAERKAIENAFISNANDITAPETLGKIPSNENTIPSAQETFKELGSDNTQTMQNLGGVYDSLFLRAGTNGRESVKNVFPTNSDPNYVGEIISSVSVFKGSEKLADKISKTLNSSGKAQATLLSLQAVFPDLAENLRKLSRDEKEAAMEQIYTILDKGRFDGSELTGKTGLLFNINPIKKNVNTFSNLYDNLQERFAIAEALKESILRTTNLGKKGIKSFPETQFGTANITGDGGYSGAIGVYRIDDREALQAIKMTPRVLMEFKQNGKSDIFNAFDKATTKAIQRVVRPKYKNNNEIFDPNSF